MVLLHKKNHFVRVSCASPQIQNNQKQITLPILRKGLCFKFELGIAAVQAIISEQTDKNNNTNANAIRAAVIFQSIECKNK